MTLQWGEWPACFCRYEEQACLQLGMSQLLLGWKLWALGLMQPALQPLQAQLLQGTLVRGLV